ncbi:hypothetical protein G3567_11245 [Psychroflexus sp. YR1-1]|uniref:Uncharacterized protein n=1 Tax=Psychroflexus aurantiacus TaxID=2709310 RepID=A0A6B3R255_9FLAO|nr:hypothetical protein [Psychroflexus aurantiacus]NEV94719.1 hypothetical protein [Psychroflexus aurantiacus]
MKMKRGIPWIVTGLGLFIIILYLINVERAFSELKSAENVRLSVRNFQISIWCAWVLITSSATYYQWTLKKYTLLVLDYLIVIIAFIFLRHYLNLGEAKNLWSFGGAFIMGSNYMTIEKFNERIDKSMED